MKAFVVVGAMGGILSEIQATVSKRASKRIQKRIDESLDIKRDKEGRYESDNDCWLEEVKLQGFSYPLVKRKKKLFLARFTQHEGENEYDQLAFLYARDQDTAEGRCVEYMKTWWTGNEDEPSMKQDEDNEWLFFEIGGGRAVELDSVTEITSFQDAISRVGKID